LGWNSGEILLEDSDKIIPKIISTFDSKHNEETIFDAIMESVKAHLKTDYDEFCNFVVERSEKFQHILSLN